MEKFKIEEDPKGKWKAGYICTYCGTFYDSKEKASQCWESHEELTWEPVWGGIGSGSDLPVEVIIKRHQRGMITEIATYKLADSKKVKMRERKKLGEK